jgi:hypothetical protein
MRIAKPNHHSIHLQQSQSLFGVYRDSHLIPFVIDRMGTPLLIFHRIRPNQDHLFSILANPLWRQLGLIG